MSDICIDPDLWTDSLRSLMLPPPATHFDRFGKLNNFIRGLRPREYTIFCGSTGSGKTQFLSQLAVDLVARQVPVYVASVETGPHDFVRRMISGVAKQNWNLGEAVGVDQIDAFIQEHKWMQTMPLELSLYEDRVDNEVLIGDIQLAADRGAKVAILDNLNFFMEVHRADQAIVEMDRVTHEMIMFCKQTDIHIIMVMHPKKTEDGRVMSEFDIKGSSTAVQEAHNVLLWNRPPKKIIEDNYERYRTFRELKIAKCRRYGAYVGGSIIYNSPDGVSYEERGYDE